jgi:hypothetical protein
MDWAGVIDKVLEKEPDAFGLLGSLVARQVIAECRIEQDPEDRTCMRFTTTPAPWLPDLGDNTVLMQTFAMFGAVRPTRIPLNDRVAIRVDWVAPNQMHWVFVMDGIPKLEVAILAASSLFQELPGDIEGHFVLGVENKKNGEDEDISFEVKRRKQAIESVVTRADGSASTHYRYAFPGTSLHDILLELIHDSHAEPALDLQ